jgi:CheY-like chemotaxis protein
MDLQMPNMDGLTASRVIMAECSTAAPLINAVSANGYECDKAACSVAGMPIPGRPPPPRVVVESKRSPDWGGANQETS